MAKPSSTTANPTQPQLPAIYNDATTIRVIVFFLKISSSIFSFFGLVVKIWCCLHVLGLNFDFKCIWVMLILREIWMGVSSMWTSFEISCNWFAVYATVGVSFGLGVVVVVVVVNEMHALLWWYSFVVVNEMHALLWWYSFEREREREREKAEVSNKKWIYFIEINF